MNITLPPIQPCAVEWPKFVEWVALKMMQDARVRYVESDEPLAPLQDISFRGHPIRFCPFCGVALDLTRPALAARHPVHTL